jgi:hypothetical protein
MTLTLTDLRADERELYQRERDQYVRWGAFEPEKSALETVERQRSRVDQANRRLQLDAADSKWPKGFDRASAIHRIRHEDGRDLADKSDAYLIGVLSANVDFDSGELLWQSTWNKDSATAPTPSELRLATGAARSMRNATPQQRAEFITRHAEHQAQLRVAHAQGEYDRNARRDEADAERRDMSKLDLARSTVAELARGVDEALALFAAGGDTSDATRLRAIKTELEGIADGDARADGAERWRRPLPNALKGTS